MGFAHVMKWGDKYSLLDSGIMGVTQNTGETFGDYRSRLLAFWAEEFPKLILKHKGNPNLIAFEILPVVGSGTGNAAQRILGQTAITTCMVIAHQKGIKVKNIAANTVKKNSTGDGRATKVKVRNAMIELFPELAPRKKELTKYSDESDAIALGVCALGYRRN